MVTETIVFALALWLGTFLIARDPAKPQLRYAGLGLVLYALAMAGRSLATRAPAAPLSEFISRISEPLLLMPALVWSGALLYLLPADLLLPHLWLRMWRRLFPVAALVVYLAGVALGPMAAPAGRGYAVAVSVAVIPLLGALAIYGLTALSRSPPFAAGTKRSVGLLLVVLLFFSLTIGLLLLPLNWLPQTWITAAIGLDVVGLALAVAILDAFNEGELLVPELFRSLDAAMLAVLTFGGIVGLAMALGVGVTFPMVALLLAIVAAAVATQTFHYQIEAVLDDLAYRAFPQLRESQATMRAEARIRPRINPGIDPNRMDEAEFTRLTRQALSQYGNLPRLASSPLTRLGLVDLRLAEQENPGDTLVRAAELKTVLTESITRLRPSSSNGFDSGDEWRFYNVLYYPYVMGLKPYSRRADHSGLSDDSRAALEWFRTYVPERTLYNWQSAAAELVARDLRERSSDSL